MGDLVHLERVRARRGPVARRRSAPAAYFYFDLACPFSYLAAERIERLFARVVWRPVLGPIVHQGDPWTDPLRAAAARAAAERRAAQLRVPLLWPEGDLGAATTAAMRVASFAAERGRAAAFAQAAMRLAWCGGFELDDPEVLAEAGDVAHDGPMELTARRLLAAGADRLPGVVANRQLFAGELRLTEAAAALRTHPGGTARVVPA